MDQENNTILLVNIIITAFVSIFYISRKYLNTNKQSKYTDEIIKKINELGLGQIDVNQLIDELKKIIPIKKDEENKIEDIKIDII